MIQKETVPILSGAIHFGCAAWFAEAREKAVRQAAAKRAPAAGPLVLRLQYGAVVLAQENGII